MEIKHPNKISILIFTGVLFILSVACSFSVFSEPTETPVPPVTQVITQVITEVVPPTQEVVTTNTPELTQTPTATIWPTLAGTYDPYSMPIWYPIEGCPASRLHIGDRAYVTYGGGPNAIRFGADIHYDTAVGYAQEGEGMVIVDGPWCYYNWIVTNIPVHSTALYPTMPEWMTCLATATLP